MAEKKVILRINHKIRRPVDNCLASEMDQINNHSDFQTIGSCCGHSKYHKTILIRKKNTKKPIFDMFSNVIINRKRRYRRDKEGIYFLPEVEFKYVLDYLFDLINESMEMKVRRIEDVS